MTHVTSSARISEKHQRRLREAFPQVRFSFFEEIGEVLDAAPEAEVLITYGEDLTPDNIPRLSNLRWVHVISAGVELLPFDALKKRKVMVTNSRGIHAIPMGEYALAVILQWTRRLHQFVDRQRERKWDRSLRVSELAGKTVAILGAGAIGRGIAKRLKAFDVTVLGMNTSGTPMDGFDEMAGPEELKSILKRSDFVVVTLPLTHQTRGLIGEEELGWMKPTACLINMARGAVVDEEALLNALTHRRIGGAVLDVFEQEPLPKEHPFWNLDNLLITPHVSGRSPMYMTRALELFHRNLVVYLSGEGKVVNLLDPDRGY
ncbi:phosphoglycerate dehydrogenase-like enzyme [Melghirimyces profundicolus]|uniref:Phosphoglycerate dehydrogenase-like enzyme n=1 Tax=Melghirimyces profundicolus TaxID=1242148 RepID=A0A2T6BX96_9BACL|nr:D-2-hydroxyacid dehydrogenase [Melghirimyces profundicolus]PTX60704.1 phosphoglycerate dehydrogenase-like enzyme [Melghirimyces profundicolus]